MGKLHTLKRAVWRDPEAFLRRTIHGKWLADGGAKYDPHTHRWVSSYWYWPHAPYRSVVRAVLREKGYDL